MSGDGRIAARVERPGSGTVRVVLLDLGGVVLDMGEAAGRPWGELDRRGREALLALLAERGRGASEGDLDRLLFTPWKRGYDRRYRVGREAPWSPHLERLARATGADAPPDRLLEVWAEPYLSSLRPVTGAQEALARLRSANLALAAVSNVPLPGRFFGRVLDEQGLGAFFQNLQFSYDAGTRKPAPGLVRAALEALEAEPASAVLVGDRRSTDIAAARAAEIASVWIESADAEGPEPDATIRSLADLPALLEV